MLSRLFGQFINSFGIVFRTFRAFFMRQIVGLTARARRITSFSRQAAKALPKAMSAAAVAGKKPTRREDYFETKRLFVAKSLIVIIILVLIVLFLLGDYLVWPWLRSTFFTAHFWRMDESVPGYSGKVVLYYDEPKQHPLFQGGLENGVIQGQGMSFDEEGMTLYAGSYSGGEYQGAGKLYSAGALVYEGQFDKGVFHGSGKLYDGDRLMYEGQFQSGVFEGAGKLYDGGGLLYDGQLSDGAYHGQGKLYSNEKITYDGGFVAGKKEGLGSEYDGGDLRYKGGFAADAYEGEGSLFGESGALLYKGGFSEGLKSGQGTSYYEYGGMQFQGGFLAGAYDGQGSAYKESGALEYVGGYREGFYQNAGTLYPDAEYSIEAVFDAGKPKGDIRIFRFGRLYYEGASEGITPHGQGRLYASTGEEIYRGKMIHGKIDAGALLGISADEARAAFADAPLSEFRGVKAGYTINNLKLGVTLFCTLKTDSSDSKVIYVYLYTKTADAFFDMMPWTTAADYEAWRDSSGLGPSDRVRPMYLIPDFTGGVPFDKERYHRTSYYYKDHIFCAWSREEGKELLIAEWITAEDLAGLNASPDEGSGSPSDKRTEALLGKLGLAPVVAASGNTEPRSPYYGSDDTMLLFSKEEGADFDADEVVNHAVNYFENAEKREIYDELIELLRAEIVKARDEAAMGKGDAAHAEALQEEIDKLELQRNKCIINMEKEQIGAEALTGLALSYYDLQQVLFVRDPADIEPETTDEKLAMMDLEMAYQELLQAQSEYTKALGGFQDARNDFALGKAVESRLSEAQRAVCDARLKVYTLLCAYTRGMLEYNERSGGALARKYNWYPDVFGVENVEAAEPSSVIGGSIIG